MMSTDSAVMLRRNFQHTLRNPTALFNAVLFPAIIMLMFVYVLGDAFSVGVHYVDYATPGMLLLAICYGLGATATAVSSDMTKGIINRFKVMDVSRGAVLTGHVIASMLNNLIAIAAIIGTAFALGFRSSAGFLDWLGVIGLVVLTSFAVGWFTVALGLAAKTVETAGLATVPLIMLPFFSSAIVPASKMPFVAGKPSGAGHSSRPRAGVHPRSSRRASPSGPHDRVRARARSTARAAARPARRRGRRRRCAPRTIRASRSAPADFAMDDDPAVGARSGAAASTSPTPNTGDHRTRQATVLAVVPPDAPTFYRFYVLR